LIKAGAICVNQCPIIKGVNDNPDTLAELFRKLSFIGAPQYYLFQGRPTEGNQPYEVPIVRGYEIFEEAKKRISGLAKRVKFSMSHETGKIEIVGVDENFIFLKYHRAHDEDNLGKMLIFKRDDEAFWFDDLESVDFSSMEQLAG
jgi:L-lysine 2,3-aminomutase